MYSICALVKKNTKCILTYITVHPPRNNKNKFGYDADADADDDDDLPVKSLPFLLHPPLGSPEITPSPHPFFFLTMDLLAPDNWHHKFLIKALVALKLYHHRSRVDCADVDAEPVDDHPSIQY